VGGGLVQDDDRRRLEQQPGQGHALLLAAGQPVAAVAGHGVETRRQRGDQIPDPSGPARLDQFRLGGTGSGVGQVGPDRVVEQVGVLRDDADRVVQRLQGHVPHVMPVDPHGAGGDVVQPGHEVSDRGLPGSGRADQRGELSGRSTKAHLVQDQRVAGGLRRGQCDRFQRGQRDLAGGRVAEADVIELDLRCAAAAPRFGSGKRTGPGTGRNRRLQVQHLEHAIKAHERGDDVDLHVGHHDDRAVQPGDQRDHGDEGADLQGAVDRERAAEPVDQRGGQRGDQGHGGEDRLAVRGGGDLDVPDPARAAREQAGLLVRAAVEPGQHRPGHAEPLGRHRGQFGLELHPLSLQPLRPPRGQLHREQEQRDQPQRHQGDLPR
jgi:hypothetical protein